MLVFGRSGCGKTTLMRRLAGQDMFRGTETGKLTVKANSHGYVWQDTASQIVCDRVESELVFGMENMGYSKELMERRLAELVMFFGLDGLLHKKTYELSTGEQQILNVASAVALKPEMMLYDEPTGSMDPASADRFLSIVKKINKELGITTILTEQRPEIFFEIADRILVMDEGRVVFNGSHDELMRAAGASSGHPGEAYLPGFIGKSGKTYEVSGCSDKNAISAKRVWFRYEQGGQDVIKDLSFELKAGSISAMVGANGSGKSTLAMLLAGLKRPYMGKVRAVGDIAYLPANPVYMFTKDKVFKELGGDRTAPEYAGALGLDVGTGAYTANMHPMDLSGGEMERLGLAIALSRECDIYILDEPTKGLDPYAKIALNDILHTMIRKNKTILLITHDVEFAAVSSDNMAMMFDGRLVAYESTEAFLNNNYFYQI